MQKTLACVAMVLAGAIAGCSKDKPAESAKAGYDVQPRGHSVPTTVARQEPIESEEQLDIESEWTTEPGMTPASGTPPEELTPASGIEPGATPTEGLPAGGPVILQFEGAEHLASALCAHETACGRIEPTRGLCEEVVKQQLMDVFDECSQGLSREELGQCVGAVERSACDSTLDEETAIAECRASSLCAR